MSNCTNVSDSAARERARVLVIDDDPLFRSLVLSALRRDYLVSVAGDGSEGFRKAVEHPPDIAVIDIQMPGWDGLKTIKAFRAHATLEQIGVVVLTSDASRETVLAALEAGANEYLIKTSFSREEFLHKLERLSNNLVAGHGKSQKAGDRPIDLAGVDTVSDLPTYPPVAPATVDSRLSSSEIDEKLLQEVLDFWE